MGNGAVVTAVVVERFHDPSARGRYGCWKDQLVPDHSDGSMSKNILEK